MTFDYSIESSFEKIQNLHTKEYFKEVYQTYINGNYRSSTVMLYSVLICDLVYKLRDLRDIYGDSKAKKVLEEIETMQTKNQNSPEWESKLIDIVKERTTLLEASDIVAIESLQKFRHLSAHPVLNNADLLFSPNRETVQALIRNILQGVLTNPPFFSNKIFDIMLADLAEVKEKINEFDSLQKYVKSRYIDQLKESEFKKIFRSLWKVVFIADDADTISNRKVNYKVLEIFISHDKPTCIELVKNEPRYYSNINKDEQISRIVVLLANFPQFYKHLEPSLLLLINEKVSTEDEFRFIGWFNKLSLKEHVANLKPENFTSISSQTFKFVKSLCEEDGCKRELIDFAIEFFGVSHNFDESQSRYEKVLKHITNDFSLEQIKRLLEVSNKNYQIYKRIGMKYNLKVITESVEGEINKELYPKIFPETT
jgi:hypothetical protein